MIKAVFILSLLFIAFIAGVSSTCVVCPQVIPNDNNVRFCASNSNGYFTLTQSQFASWNCNHPFNQFTQTSSLPCVTNGVNCPYTCTQSGPVVCGQLADPGTLSVTVAQFANLCQLNYYNCRNPGSYYTQTLCTYF